MFPSRRYDVGEDHSLPEQLQGTQTQTQLGRLFTQLHMTSIAARSPQAKGRIERLWGTFQDRLVSELRLAHAQAIEEANAILQDYLPQYLRRKVAKVRAANCAHMLLLVYKGLNVTEEAFQETASEALFFQQTPVLKEVMEAVETIAERVYGPRPHSKRVQKPSKKLEEPTEE